MNQERSRAYSKYIGVPYVDKGRDMRGWDCYGLYVFVLAEQFDIHINPYTDTYSSTDAEAEVNRAIRTVLNSGAFSRVAEGDEREGDAIVFNLFGQPLHCGYVLERGTMLHALKGRETCTERYDGAGWNKRIEGIYRWT